MSNVLRSVKLDHDIMKSRYPFFLIDAIGILLAAITKVPVFGALVILVVSAPIVGQYFAVYDKNNLDKLYGILPLRKSEVVIGRYLFALCIIIINGIIATVVAIVVSRLTHKPMGGAELLTYLSVGFAYACFTIAVIFPLYFKFSYSKVYVVSNLPFYVIFIVAFDLTRRKNLLEQTGPAVQHLASNLTIPAIGFGLGLILLVLSCLLSCALVEENRPAGPPQEGSGRRMYFADNLRTWMVILVVLQHVAVLYNTLYLFMMLNQAYFMGMLFLLSGYFTPGSFERKGPGKFLTDRLLRLGIPTLIYVFVLNPIASWGYRSVHSPAAKTAAGHFALGPMWFVVMLLLFDLGYLAWRTLVKNKPEGQPQPDSTKRLSFHAVALFMLSLAAATYLLRVGVPYGIPVFDFPSLGYAAQYLSFFVIGILANRRDWFRSIPGSLGQLGFVVAMLASVTLFPVAIVGSHGASLWIGYGSWQSAVFALWDAIFAVGISLALITFFRRFFNGGKDAGRFMSGHSYFVYVIHVPIIIFVILALSGLQSPVLMKLCMAALFSLPICFAIGWLIRKIPYVRTII